MVYNESRPLTEVDEDVVYVGRGACCEGTAGGGWRRTAAAAAWLAGWLADPHHNTIIKWLVMERGEEEER